MNQPHRPRLTAVAGLLLAIALPFAAAAQESRYGEWRSEAQQTEQELQRLVEELQAIVAEGRRAQAAHPTFLQDLQALVDRYRRPRRVVFLRDDFDDGNFDRAPEWDVVQGRFEVDPRGALLTYLPVDEPTAQRDELDPNARIIFGIIDEMTRERGTGNAERDRDAPRVQRYRLATSAHVDNDFTLELTLRSHGNRWGGTQVGVYQGKRLRSGYRLVYRAGDGPLQLVALRRGRPAILAQAATRGLGLDDGRAHRVAWTRDGDGTMRVSIDERELLRVLDNSYRDPFTGVVLVNDGGRYRFDDLVVYAER